MVLRWISNFFNLLYPRICQLCGQPLLQSETVICTSCVMQLPYTNYWKYEDNPVAQKFWGQVEVNNACSLLYYRKGTKVRKLIHHLKYKGNTKIGYKLGYLLGIYLKEQVSYADVSFVVPVPLHPKRLKKRGYNQSDFIADGVAAAMGVEKYSRLVERRIFTQTQTRKNRIERFQNVRSIFVVNKPATIEGKHILLVDDVITTGATIESCAAEILEAVSCKVSIVSIGTV